MGAASVMTTSKSVEQVFTFLTPTESITIAPTLLMLSIGLILQALLQPVLLITF